MAGVPPCISCFFVAYVLGRVLATLPEGVHGDFPLRRQTSHVISWQMTHLAFVVYCPHRSKYVHCVWPFSFVTARIEDPTKWVWIHLFSEKVQKMAGVPPCFWWFLVLRIEAEYKSLEASNSLKSQIKKLAGAPPCFWCFLVLRI